MTEFDTKYLWIGLVILLVGLVFFGDKLGVGKELQTGAVLEVKMAIVEPDVQAIITSPVKTKVDVTTVPFKLTVINSGSIPLSNVRITTGTIPTQLVTAFTGKSIANLSPGASGVLISDVDVSLLAPESGSQVVNFQAYVAADYIVSGSTFTKSGFSEVLQTTIYPSQGLSVTVVYE